MARRKQVDACLYCDSVPCQCESLTKTASKKIAPKRIAPPAPPAPKRLTAPPVIVPPVKQLTTDIPDHDLLLHYAIRCLADAKLLSTSDRDKYDYILRTPMTIADRSAVWKARRRVEEDGSTHTE